MPMRLRADKAEKRWLCATHPTYQVKREPRAACAGCWILWFAKLEFCRLEPPSRPKVPRLEVEQNDDGTVNVTGVF